MTLLSFLLYTRNTLTAKHAEDPVVAQAVTALRRFALQASGNLNALSDRALSLPQTETQLLREALTELAATLEEMTVAEETLREDQEKWAETYARLDSDLRHYRKHFDLAPEPYVVTDVQGVIREVNHAGVTLLGLPPEQLIRKSLATFITDDDRQDFRKLLTALLRDGTQRSQLHLLRRDGSRYNASVTAAPVHGNDTVVHGFRWIVRDLGETEGLEQAVRVRDEMISALSLAAALTVGEDALITYITPEFGKWIGAGTTVLGHPLLRVLQPWLAEPGIDLSAIVAAGQEMLIGLRPHPETGNSFRLRYTAHGSVGVWAIEPVQATITVHSGVPASPLAMRSVEAWIEDVHAALATPAERRRRRNCVERIRKSFYNAVFTGRLRPGDRLPSIRTLSSAVGVNHKLVRRAYHELRAEGLVDVRMRSGVFVAAQKAVGGNLSPDAQLVRMLLKEAWQRGTSATRLGHWLAAYFSRELRCACIAEAATAEPLCSALGVSFGVQAFHIEPPASGDELASATTSHINQLDFAVVTPSHARLVRNARVTVPVAVATVSRDHTHTDDPRLRLSDDAAAQIIDIIATRAIRQAEPLIA